MDALITIATQHEGRLTKLETAQQVNLPQLIQRLEALEAEAEQRRTDGEQAARRELADLRKKLDAAEAEARRLRDAQAVDAVASAVPKR